MIETPDHGPAYGTPDGRSGRYVTLDTLRPGDEILWNGEGRIVATVDAFAPDHCLTLVGDEDERPETGWRPGWMQLLITPTPNQETAMSTLTISDAPRPYRDRSSDHVAIVECQSDDHARWTMRHQVIWQYRYLRSRGVGPLSARAGVIGSLFTRGYPMSMVVVDHTER